MRSAILVVLTACLAVGAIGGGSASEAIERGPMVDVTFNFQRQSGMASNQFAVWVEDADGKVVRTLYVTNFTAGHGGWKIREQSLPLWVKSADIAAMNQEQVDALTGATPGSGSFGQQWDCRDASGKELPPGEYVVIVEGTLRAESRVVYRAPIVLGGERTVVRPEPEYFGDDRNERTMISRVEVRYTDAH